MSRHLNLSLETLRTLQHEALGTVRGGVLSNDCTATCCYTVYCDSTSLDRTVTRHQEESLQVCNG